MYSHYKKLRILHLSSQGYKPPTIARMLEEEGMKASRRGIGKFLKVGRLRVDISLDRRSMTYLWCRPTTLAFVFLISV